MLWLIGTRWWLQEQGPWHIKKKWIMRYTESKQRNVSRHSDSGYRIQKRQPKHMSIVCETAPTLRNGVINISTTSVGEGSLEHGLALGQHLGRLPWNLQSVNEKLSPPGYCQNRVHDNELNRLRIPTGKKQTSWLCTSAAQELNPGTTSN